MLTRKHIDQESAYQEKKLIQEKCRTTNPGQERNMIRNNAKQENADHENDDQENTDQENVVQEKY